MPNLTSLLDDHVALKYECLDRILLNGYVAKLQIPEDLSWFLCQHRGEAIPRYQLLGEMTGAFLRAVEALATQRRIPVVHFECGQRKEEIAAPYFARATREGVVLIGLAQALQRKNSISDGRLLGAPRPRPSGSGTIRAPFVDHRPSESHPGWNLRQPECPIGQSDRPESS